MWFSTDDTQNTTPEEVDLYSILNINQGASQTEINERYRALSLLFHPDKQQNSDTKEAEEEYFKVQKAYQVLSDPFLRQVYDVLGLPGLALKWPADLPSQSQKKIEEELCNIKKNGHHEHFFDPEAPMRTQLNATVDMAALFKPIGALHGRRPIHSLSDRFEYIRIVADEFRHTFSKRINNKTAVSLESHSFAAVNGSGSMQYTGTVRHQFSPRLSGVASVGLKGPFPIVLRGTYRDDYNTFQTKAAFSPVTSHYPPSATLSYSRRLFQHCPQTGEIALHLQNIPTLSLHYVSPTSVFQSIFEAAQQGVPSVSGFRHIAFDQRIGLIFSDILPKLSGEAGVTFIELSTRFKVGFELGFVQSILSVGIGWVKGDNQMAFETVVSTEAVIVKLDVAIWRQQFSLPMILSTEWNPRVALCSIVFPSLLTTLSYAFLVRPRRRARRIAQIRAARQTLEEDSGATRKRRAVTDLLKDVASKYTCLEVAKGGLVIQEASYGVTDEKDGAQDLAVDVTIPVQALVRNSQLYIPGSNLKSNLQGFSDPAPFTSKSLRIRYVFRGRFHYAEIPEYTPVVLPLSEHSVGEC